LGTDPPRQCGAPGPLRLRAPPRSTRCAAGVHRIGPAVMPPPLSLDFAQGDRRRGGVVLLISGVAAVAMVVASYVDVQRETEAIQARSEMLARRADSPRPASRAGPHEARAWINRIEASNRILAALERPWIRLFDDLESAQVDGVVLLAMEPDAASGQLRLVGEALDRDTLARYLERLGRLGSLREVRLNQHEVRTAQGTSVLRFVVSSRWGGAG